MKIFTNDQIAAVLDVRLASDAIRDAYLDLQNGTAAVQPRARIGLSDVKFSAMSAMLGLAKVAAIKMYTTIDGQFRFYIALFSLVDGGLLAMLEGDAITGVRTAATGRAHGCDPRACGPTSGASGEPTPRTVRQWRAGAGSCRGLGRTSRIARSDDSQPRCRIRACTCRQPRASVRSQRIGGRCRSVRRRRHRCRRNACIRTGHTRRVATTGCIRREYRRDASRSTRTRRRVVARGLAHRRGLDAADAVRNG